MGKTGGELNKENKAFLMGDAHYPEWGYRPIDVKKRIAKLREIESRAKEICIRKDFKAIGIACPYCGYSHG